MALLGGETAEMPGLYPKGEYDLVGTVVGTVERKKLITGKKIKKGDVIIGLPSSGLQTNGYSLARHIIFKKAGMKLSDFVPGTRTTFEKALLAIHKSYLHPVSAVMKKVHIHGMAHITGGGLHDNIPRILPESVDAVIDTSSWKPQAIFSFMQEAGSVSSDEMFRVFNMGIGYMLIVSKNDVDTTLKILKKEKQPAKVIGEIKAGERKTVLV
jgi:phosphoribosylformylglycinamidine cyclo-ligase